MKSASATDVTGKVVFRGYDTTPPVPVDVTILDAADDAGVFIDNACRSGTCKVEEQVAEHSQLG